MREKSSAPGNSHDTTLVSVYSSYFPPARLGQTAGTVTTADLLPGKPDAASLRAALAAIESDGRGRLDAATDLSGLQAAERHILGRRSELAKLHTLLRDLPPEER